MAKMQLGALVSASQAWLQRSQMTLSSVHEKKWTAAALGGCLAELSGSSAAPVLTVAFRLVHQVQQQGETVAWISSDENGFFRPDVADGGLTFRRYRLFALLPFSNDLLQLNNSCVLVLLDCR